MFQLLCHPPGYGSGYTCNRLQQSRCHPQGGEDQKGNHRQINPRIQNLPWRVRIFRHYIRIINHKSRVNDPNYLQIGLKCGELEQLVSRCTLLLEQFQRAPTHKLEINETVANRQEIDEKIEAMIKEEEFKTQLLLVSLGLLLALLSYLAFTFFN